MVKICTKCKSEKPISEFAFRNKKTGKFASNCKSCQKSMKDKHYNTNKTRYLERNRKRKKEKREWWLNLKNTLSCKNCGISHVAVLDFHHRDPTEKEFTISNFYRIYEKKKILLELEKCDVLCSNCHRILHWNMDHSSSG